MAATAVSATIHRRGRRAGEEMTRRMGREFRRAGQARLARRMVERGRPSRMLTYRFSGTSSSDSPSWFARGSILPSTSAPPADARCWARSARTGSNCTRCTGSRTRRGELGNTCDGMRPVSSKASARPSDSRAQRPPTWRWTSSRPAWTAGVWTTGWSTAAGSCSKTPSAIAMTGPPTSACRCVRQCAARGAVRAHGHPVPAVQHRCSSSPLTRARACRAEAAQLLLIPDLCHHALRPTGRPNHERDHHAAPGGGYRAHGTRSCSSGWRCPRALMPEIVPAGRPLGPLRTGARSRRAGSSVPMIAPATHDTASAVAGTPLEPGGPTSLPAPGRWSASSARRRSGDAEAARANFTNEGGASARCAC